MLATIALLNPVWQFTDNQISKSRDAMISCILSKGINCRYTICIRNVSVRQAAFRIFETDRFQVWSRSSQTYPLITSVWSGDLIFRVGFPHNFMIVHYWTSSLDPWSPSMGNFILATALVYFTKPFSGKQQRYNLHEGQVDRQGINDINTLWRFKPRLNYTEKPYCTGPGHLI